MENSSLEKALLRLALIPAVLIASLVTSCTVLFVGGGNFGGNELIIIFIVTLAVYSVLTWRYLKKTKKRTDN